MIKQQPNGNWLVQGITPGVIAVIPAKEMSDFIHAEAQKLADRALAILIEHQRHTLLPEQRECVRCGTTSLVGSPDACHSCGSMVFRGLPSKQRGAQE